ncbi:hypothetical protein [Streptomyces sp. NPDC059272]|uniref:hypothetical protein n=1 Tax=Streptomyces sp. NPDC059272 TaxID=3346800 RepID=UPI003689AF03
MSGFGQQMGADSGGDRGGEPLGQATHSAGQAYGKRFRLPGGAGETDDPGVQAVRAADVRPSLHFWSSELALPIRRPSGQRSMKVKNWL